MSIARNWGDVEPRFHEQRTLYNRQSNSHLFYYPNRRLLLAQIDSLKMMFRTIRIITMPSIQKRTLTPFIVIRIYLYTCLCNFITQGSILRGSIFRAPSSDLNLHPLYSHSPSLLLHYYPSLSLSSKTNQIEAYSPYPQRKSPAYSYNPAAYTKTNPTARCQSPHMPLLSSIRPH